MRCALLFVAVFGLSVVACQDQSPVAPAIPDGPVFQISDGHSVGGNSGFFFLAPIRRLSEDATVPATGFNPVLDPVIEVFECVVQTATGCDLPLGALKSRITKTSGSTLLNRLYVFPRFHEYAALWDTRGLNLRTDRTYRIQVSVGGAVLGFADVDVVRTIREAARVDRDDFVPLLQNFFLPIRFWVGNTALCAGTACASKTIDLSAGGGLELLAAGEDFKVDIPPGTTATFGGLPVTSVTVNLEVCSGIDVDLPTFGPCLRLATYFDATSGGELEFTQPLKISMCVLNSVYRTPNETRQQGLITLHQQDGTLIRALPHTDPNCGAGITTTSGWDWLKSLAARFLTPPPAYAATRTALLHVGAGGETTTLAPSCAPPPSPVPGMMLATTCPPSSPVTRSGPRPSPTATATPPKTVSDFQFALPAKMDYLNLGDVDRAVPVETLLPTAVRVTDWDGTAVAGARVTFIDPASEGGPVGVATSDDRGVAQISWLIRAGANTVVATGRGIAAQNNYPDATVKPFMPDITPGAVERPVALGTGKVRFTATGTLLGGLSFIQQPTNTPSGLAISPALQIRILDPSGAPVTEVVRVTVGNDPANPAACLVLQASQLAINGIATFDNVRVNGLCTGARIAATAGGGSFHYPLIYSDLFDITAPPVSLAVAFTTTDVPLEGSVPYVATVTNNGGALAGVVVQASIDQGNASRAAGGAVMSGCAVGSRDGDLPPGSCSINRNLVASNLNSGTGTLALGPATGRITVEWSGVVVATVLVPITIVP